jgi:glutathione S-transferase
MLEWMPIFLPSLWLFALTLSDRWAALVGLAWVAGRVLYLVTYAEAADRRGRGFAIQATAAGVLFLGALVGVGNALITG